MKTLIELLLPSVPTLIVGTVAAYIAYQQYQTKLTNI